MAWLSSGRVTNPVTDQVLLDTGPLAGDAWLNISLIGASTVAAVFELQLRNAANTATLKSQILAVPASGTNNFNTPPSAQFPTLANERLRVIAVSGFTGSCSVSIFAPI